MIALSVIVPTYNRCGRLRATLDALARQALPFATFEVIVVVDGSTDGTVEMLARLETPYSLVVVSQPNSGQQVGRNRGVGVARGEYCLFIDDDIVLAPGALAAHLRVQREEDGVVGLGSIRTTVPTEAPWFSRAFADTWNRQYDRFDAGKRGTGWTYCYGGNLSMPKREFLATGGFAPDMRRGHDVELGYRLAERGLRFVYIPDARGTQDERKNSGQLIGDFENYGVAAAAIYRRHPGARAEVIPPFHTRGGGPEWLRRALLRVGLHPRVLLIVGSLSRARRWRQQWFRVLQRYCFWRGLQRALNDPVTWRQVTRPTPGPHDDTGAASGTCTGRRADGHPMTIVHFIGTIRLPLKPDSEATGGVARAVLEIARAQAREGHSVWVVAVDRVAARDEWCGVRLARLRRAEWGRWLRPRWPNLPEHLPLVALTAIRRFDVVHLHEHWTTRFIRARTCVVHVHNDPFGEPTTDRFARKARAFWSRVGWSRAQIGVSRFVARRLAEGRRTAHGTPDGNSVHAVYNGVDRERFGAERSIEARSRIRDTWGSGADDVVCLYAGAFAPEKGTLCLVRAFVERSKHEPRLRLVLAGGEALWRRPTARPDAGREAYEREVLEVLAPARANGRAHVLGVVAPEDLPAVYGASDVVVVPSIAQEAFGLVVVEAMAAGRAVIASRVGGIVEVVGDDAALLVPPGDESALSEALARLAADPVLRADLGARARERAHAFSWTATAARLVDIYRRAIDAPLARASGVSSREPRIGLAAARPVTESVT